MRARHALALSLDREHRVGRPRGPGRDGELLRGVEAHGVVLDHPEHDRTSIRVDRLDAAPARSAERPHRVLAHAEARPFVDRAVDRLVEALDRLVSADLGVCGNRERQLGVGRGVLRLRRGLGARRQMLDVEALEADDAGRPGRNAVLELGRLAAAVEAPSRHGRKE